MYIHLGENKQVSISKTLGIFNIETLRLSSNNEFLFAQAEDDDKTLALSINNIITCSKVSPYTIVKRTAIKEDVVWRRDDNE